MYLRPTHGIPAKAQPGPVPSVRGEVGERHIRMLGGWVEHRFIHAD